LKRQVQGIVTAMADTVLTHPNRDKAESKATKAVVILLLVTSAALILIVTLGGWSQLQGMQIVSFGYAIVYLVMAYFVANWNRGVLPVAAGLAILFAVVAAVAGPAWFERDKTGFDDPALEPSILGLLTIILVPVQLLLVAFAMRGFQQQWSTEIEVPREEAERGRAGGDSRDSQVQAA
jgi:protein-S-isoprenylcysteine O-methyltransferase Ste14